MSYQYFLEEVDPKKTEELRKKKEDQEKRQQEAWEAEKQDNPQKPPLQKA